MAHIEKRKTSKGETRYRAQVILKGQPRVSETFSTRRAATRCVPRRRRGSAATSQSQSPNIARDNLARGQSLSGKVPSPHTVKRYLAILSRAMSVAAREW